MERAGAHTKKLGPITMEANKSPDLQGEWAEPG